MVGYLGNWRIYLCMILFVALLKCNLRMTLFMILKGKSLKCRIVLTLLLIWSSFLVHCFFLFFLPFLVVVLILLSYITFQSLFPNLHTPQSLFLTYHLPQTHSSSLSIQKRAGLPGASTEHYITSCSKTRHKPSCQGRQGKPVGGKGSQDPIKESETPILQILGETQEHKAMQP